MSFGFLRDDAGDLSSGRLIKITSLITAVLISIAGIVLVVLFPTNAAIGTYCLAASGSYLAVTTGSEIVQKVTGK